MSAEKKIVNFHFPKTAGTTVLGEFSKAFRPQDVLVWDVHKKGFVTSNNKRVASHTEAIDRMFTIFRQTPFFPIVGYLLFKLGSLKQKEVFDMNNLPANWKVLHGHFDSSVILENSQQLTQDAVLAIGTIVAEPLKRVMSQYNYWRIWSPARRMKFEDFANQPELQNFQSTTLQGLNLNNVILGTMNDIGGYLKRITCGMKLENGYQFTNVGRLNVNPRPNYDLQSYGIKNPEEFIAGFRAKNKQDYELYSQALVQGGKVI